jgi:predicted metal-dependent HD superfamily phosphohydrolase
LNEGARTHELTARFRGALARVGVDRNSDAVVREVLERYEEPHRAYHNATHVGECLTWLDRFELAADAAALIETAVWFHDVVYDPPASDNEDHSADLARRMLASAGLPSPITARIADLVRATKHDTPPGDDDARVICDVDLAILGASHIRFDEYEKQTRDEHRWMSDAAYGEERSRLLIGLARRDRIYWTDTVSDRIEVEARLNIGRSLARLSRPDDFFVAFAPRKGG